jgi:hypothetical protein
MAAKTTTTNNFELRAARFSDLSSIATAWTAAFFDDEIIGELMHPHRNNCPDDVYWFLLRGIRERFWDWRHQFIVVTEDGKVVGAADWRRLGRGGEDKELGGADPRMSFSKADERAIQLTPNASQVISSHQF